jgi:hypothetical protein
VMFFLGTHVSQSAVGTLTPPRYAKWAASNAAIRPARFSKPWKPLPLTFGTAGVWTWNS